MCKFCYLNLPCDVISPRRIKDPGYTLIIYSAVSIFCLEFSIFELWMESATPGKSSFSILRCNPRIYGPGNLEYEDVEIGFPDADGTDQDEMRMRWELLARIRTCIHRVKIPDAAYAYVLVSSTPSPTSSSTPSSTWPSPHNNNKNVFLSTAGSGE
jgi:hypothetical protein